MSNFVNILDIIYPVGSMYFSINNVSPASSVGGTWEQIKDAVLAASGDSYAGDVDKYNGNKYILYRQMPFHSHELDIADVNAVTFSHYKNAISNTGYKWSNHLAGNSEIVNLKKQLLDDIASKGNGMNSMNYQLPDKFYPITDNSLMKSTSIAAGGRTTFHTTIQSTYGNVLPNIFEGVGL